MVRQEVKPLSWHQGDRVFTLRSPLSLSLFQGAKIEFFTLLSKLGTLLFCLNNATFSFPGAHLTFSLTGRCKSAIGVLSGLCKRATPTLAHKKEGDRHLLSPQLASVRNGMSTFDQGKQRRYLLRNEILHKLHIAAYGMHSLSPDSCRVRTGLFSHAKVGRHNILGRHTLL